LTSVSSLEGSKAINDTPQALYLDLVESCLLNLIYEDAATAMNLRGDLLAFNVEKRRLGRDWPSMAPTMIGQSRLHNLRELAATAINQNIPGDFIETGVWRGGACIMMRAVLKAFDDTSRRVFVADSFEGLPKPNAELYPADTGDRHYQFPQLAVSLENVQANFAKYRLLDAQVVFLKGWFKDTLPGAPIAQLAILRLDGDLYESTMDALHALYHKVSPGGFVIVDDYGAVPACKRAIHDFRTARNISDPMITIDHDGVYWRKT
jgi:O-methyltransferase